MFKKRSMQVELEEKIKQFEKETFERGLVEHLPSNQNSERPVLTGKFDGKLKFF